MKKLYFLRHAKSGHPFGVDDKNRPINKQGQQSCEIVGKYLIENNIRPELVLCSEALRTTQTAKAVFAGQTGVNFEYNKKLYLATPGEIIKEIAKVSDKVNSLMVVAHNPGIQEITVILSQSMDIQILKDIRSDYPTCALTEFSFNIEKWEEVSPGGGNLERYIKPKEL